MAHIIVVLDKSGSMGSIAGTVISGFNEFLQSQKRVVDGSTMTMIQFSDNVEVTFASRPIADVPELTQESYRPDGMTALNDAIVSAVNNHNSSPQTLAVIITDGEENASSERNKDPEVIQRLIQQRTAEGWRFIYLCNNLQTAFAGAARGLASATRGAHNPATQNLVVEQANFGTVLSRQVSAAACAYRTTSEVAAIDELSSNVSQMNINVIPPDRTSRVRGNPIGGPAGLSAAAPTVSAPPLMRSYSAYNPRNPATTGLPPRNLSASFMAAGPQDLNASFCGPSQGVDEDSDEGDVNMN